MRIDIVKAASDCSHDGWKKGDLLLIDADHDWDPNKVIVMAVLQQGASPGLSAYKQSVSKANQEEIYDYLTNKGVCV